MTSDVGAESSVKENERFFVPESPSVIVGELDVRVNVSATTTAAAVKDRLTWSIF